MSATYGRLQGSRGAVTRTGGQTICAILNTWQKRIDVWLDKENGTAIEICDYPSGARLARFDGTIEELIAKLSA